MGFLDWFKTPDYDAMLQDDFARLLADDPVTAGIWENAKVAGYIVSITRGTLEGNVEGRTVVTPHGAVVVIDVIKVIRKRDRLEPVIGHELFHVNDALTVYGIDKFLNICADESSLPWRHKTLEQTAIKQENELRARLIAAHPETYTGMATTRDLQNARAWH